MSTAFLDTAVIGAGAAGLTVGRHLSELDRTFELFDEHARVGDSWRERYRSLRLFTPRRFASLPGLRLDVGMFGYPTGQQMGDYLERYAQHFRLPVRTSSRVVALTRSADGPFRLELGDGDEVFAEHVIVTAGAHRVPVVPEFASELDPSIRQLHSLDYQGPEQFAEGPVLVVGAGELRHGCRARGRPHRARRDPRRPAPGTGPRRYRPAVRQHRERTLHPPPPQHHDRQRARTRDEADHHGVMLVRNRLADLDRAGVVRIGRVSGVTAGRPIADGAAPIDAATIVWCTGSRADLGWIRIDDVFGPDGAPREYRGIATGCRGLAFVGLEFQYSVASATLMGMDRDARHVVQELFTGDGVATSAEATDRAVA